MNQSDVSAGISPRQSFDSWAKFVAELEAEGVGRVWVIDSQLAMKDVYAGLVVAAMNTSRVGLGTGVTNAVTRHPTITANAIAAIDEISRGRAILGLGAGDSALYGIGLKPQKVAEVAGAVDFFRANVARSVPIYLAVSQERMCDLAGRVADGAIVMGPAQPDMVRKQVEWIRAGGREMEIALIAPTSTDIEDVRSWASTQARLMSHHKQLPDSLASFRDEIARSATCRRTPSTAPRCPTSWCAPWQSSAPTTSARRGCASFGRPASTRSSSRWPDAAGRIGGGRSATRSWSADRRLPRDSPDYHPFGRHDKRR